MKHFEPQYNEREDSPLDLSGREGAPRVHDSDYCKCEMCVAADKYEREHQPMPIDRSRSVDTRSGCWCATAHSRDTCPNWKEDESVLNDVDAVLMGLSPFAAAWASAPETQRRYTERDCAAYWFEQGQIAGMGTIKQDLAEMRQLMREKGLA